MSTYSEEERRRAAEQLAVLGWGEEWKAEVHPDEVAEEVRRIRTGSGILIPASKMVDLVCRVNELEEQNRWIPVGERLPLPKVYVLGIGGNVLHVPYPMKMLPSEDGYEFWFGMSQRKPTHWRPLPAPPETEEDSK